jgi:hypothetical protein
MNSTKPKTKIIEVKKTMNTDSEEIRIHRTEKNKYFELGDLNNYNDNLDVSTIEPTSLTELINCVNICSVYANQWYVNLTGAGSHVAIYSGRITNLNKQINKYRIIRYNKIALKFSSLAFSIPVKLLFAKIFSFISDAFSTKS